MSFTLVTGASGFLGRHLVPFLQSRGRQIITFDFLPQTKKLSGVRNITGNLVTGQGFEQIPWQALDTVFHLAASGVKASQRDWVGCVNTNVCGTANLITQLTSTRSPAKLIYAHTCYEDALKAEGGSWLDNPYVMTKYVTTQFVRSCAAHVLGGIATAKLFQVYGEGDNPNNLLPYALATLRAGEVARFGSGKGLRDWIYVSDLVAGLEACEQAIEVRHPQAFDLGSGQLKSIKSMVEMLATILKVPHDRLDFDPARDRADVELTLRAQNPPPDWHCGIHPEQGLKVFSGRS